MPDHQDFKIMYYKTNNKPRLELLVGGMFAGKTFEFIRRLDKCVIAELEVIVFKPVIDQRYGDGITSHSKLDLETITGLKPICLQCDLSDIQLYEQKIKQADVIAFDEVQFFTNEIVEFVDYIMRKEGKRVICAGLDQDAFGNPFGPVPFLLSKAHEVLKLTGICSVCKEPSTKTFKKPSNNNFSFNKESNILVGGADDFEPRCDDCWYGIATSTDLE